MRTSGISRVWLTPADVQPSEDALAAIAEADLIVLGPGSLYTSLLPSLLIPGIRDALLASHAPRVFVCNVATQDGETAGFDLAEHVEALVAHTAPGIVDIVLANNRFEARVPAVWHAEPVRLRWPPTVTPLPRLVLDDVVDPANAHHHDPSAWRWPCSRSSSARPAPGASPSPGPPDACRSRPTDSPVATPRPVTRSERDLVLALRAELAGIDPSRACDRIAEAAGLGSSAVRREGPVARLAVRLRRGSEGIGRTGRRRRATRPRPRRRRPWRARRPSTGTAPPSIAGRPGCAAASSPAARSACRAGGRTSSSWSTRPRRRSSPRGSRTSSCRRRGGSGAAAAS